MIANDCIVIHCHPSEDVASDGAITAMKHLIAILTASSSLAFAIAPSFAGQGRAIACYEQVNRSAEVATVEETVLVRPASTVYDVLPARYGNETRRVLVEPEQIVRSVIPAEYRAVEERVLVRPATTVHLRAEPRYRTVAETVEVSPAHETWRWRVIHGKRVYCRTLIPARYATRNRHVLVNPGETYAQHVPAEYATQVRNVLVAPQSYTEHVIPARYQTVTEQIVLEPAQRIAREIPAQYTTRYRTVTTRQAESGWRQVHLRHSC